MAGNVSCHREAKEDKKSGVHCIWKYEVISEMQTLLAAEVRGAGPRRSDALKPIIRKLAPLVCLPSLGPVASPLKAVFMSAPPSFVLLALPVQLSKPHSPPPVNFSHLFTHLANIY